MLSIEETIKKDPNRIHITYQPKHAIYRPRHCYATRARLSFSLKHEAEQTVHFDPLPSAFLQISIHHALNSTKSGPVEFDQSRYTVLFLPSLLCGRGLDLVRIEETSEVKQLVVELLFRVFVRHSPETTFSVAPWPETPVSINADLPCTVATRRIVANKPAFVVLGSLCSDLALQLCNDCQNRERLLTALVRTDETVGRAHVG